MADWVDQGKKKETNTKLTHNVIHLDTNNDMDKNVFFFFIKRFEKEWEKNWRNSILILYKYTGGMLCGSMVSTHFSKWWWWPTEYGQTHGRRKGKVGWWNQEMKSKRTYLIVFLFLIFKNNSRATSFMCQIVIVLCVCMCNVCFILSIKFFSGYD